MTTTSTAVDQHEAGRRAPGPRRGRAGSAPTPRSKLRLNQPKKPPLASGLAFVGRLQQGGAQRRRQHQGHQIDSAMAETMVTENWR